MSFEAPPHTGIFNWPMFVFMLGAIGGTMVWLKKKIIDDVFATKGELVECQMKVHAKIDSMEARAIIARTEIKEQITNNHDEIKNLIIDHLGNKDVD